MFSNRTRWSPTLPPVLSRIGTKVVQRHLYGLVWLRSRVSGHSRAQALVETALVAPLLVLFLGGVADLGRAFYFKIAVTNAAREAAHWASIIDPTTNQPPTDNAVDQDVTNPSQESFGIGLGLAPSSILHTSPPVRPTVLSGASPALAPGRSYLFIWPDANGRKTGSAMLPPGAHWRLVGYDSRVVVAPDPANGGLRQVLASIPAALTPVDANADRGGCWSLTGTTVTVAPSQVSDPGTGTFSWTVTVTVNATGGNGSSSNNDVSLEMTSISPSGIAGFAKGWNSTHGGTSGSVTLNGSGKATDTATFGIQSASPSPPDYSLTIRATLNSASGCPSSNANGSETVTVQPSTSPSPSPSPVGSPSPVPTPSPTVSPGPTPTPSAPPPNGAQITCTVIYYFQPITPALDLFFGSTVYIVGDATLEAIY